MIVPKGWDKHTLVVQDRNALLPGCEVTAVLGFCLRGEKVQEGDLENYHRNTSGRRVDDC